jgi:REP element-mobilizing transposase RayT
MGQPYDPQKHHRCSIRLQDWDYRFPGYYFVTICTYRRLNLFDDSALKEIVEMTWRLIPEHPHASHVQLDEWIVMPNHIHGILALTRLEGDPEAPPPEKGARPRSLSSIIGTFKSMVTRRINRARGTPGGKVWQRGFYERIVRNDRELQAIRRYIRANPARWAEDRENLDSLIARMETGDRS